MNASASSTNRTIRSKPKRSPSGSFARVSPSSPARPRLSELQLIAMAYGVATMGVYAWLANWQTIDFRNFYDAGLGFRQGTSMHTLRPGDHGFNLNPPTFAILFSPLTVLPYYGALGVWLALQLVLVVDMTRRILAVTGWRPLWWIVAALVALVPSQLAWHEGQVIWVLAYFMTRAWLAPSTLSSGLWLAVAIAIKPPLAIVPLLLGWRICLTAGAGSLAITMAAVAVTGWPAWQEWLAKSGDVNWITLVHNVSLWGLLGRVSLGRIYDVWLVTLPPWIALTVPFTGILTADWILRRTSGHRRWALAILWSVWLSPAGWSYYLPLAIGPGVASWPASRWAVVGLAILAIPDPVVYALSHQPTGQWTICSLYSVAMLAVLWGWGPAVRGREA